MSAVRRKNSVSGRCCRALVSGSGRGHFMWQAEGRASPVKTSMHLCQCGLRLLAWSAATTAIDQIAYDCRISSAACSPITTQVAMVFPVVMRGMIEASAMRRQLMP